MSELLEAIDGLTAALTESLRHPKHAVTIGPLRNKLGKMLRRRFNRQHTKFLRESRKWLKWMADKYSEADADKKAAIKHGVTVNIESGATLTSEPSAMDESIYDAAITAAAGGAIRTISVELAIELAKEQADAFTENYLKTNSFQKLAADVDDTTRQRIANGVADVYAKGGSYDDAVKAISDAFSEASEYRANMIAQTELNDVYNSAMLDSAKQAGDMLKTWEPDGECCDLCQENVDAGAIALDEDFPSGDDAPPLHVNCDCSLGFVKAEDAE